MEYKMKVRQATTIGQIAVGQKRALSHSNHELTRPFKMNVCSCVPTTTDKVLKIEKIMQNIEVRKLNSSIRGIRLIFHSFIPFKCKILR
jgi:hypothetical protein